MHLNEMITKFIRSIIWRLPNSFRYGKRYRQITKEIINFNELKIDEQRKIQLEKINEILKYAYFNVPYYKELFDKYNISYKINSFEEFERIPYLTKDIIRKNKSKLKSREKILCSKVTTGGTTGMPMEFYLDKSVQINEIAFVDYYWKKFNCEYSNSCKIAIIRGNIPKNGKNFEQIGNRLILSSFNLKEDTVKLYITELVKFNPDFIHIYPSSMGIIADYIIKNEIKVDLKNLKGIFSSSETLSSIQRENIEKAFNVTICDLYGHSERAVMAFDNIGGNKNYCLNLLYGYTELINLDEKNIILNEDQQGEIIATSFWNKSFPLIRYKTCDCAVSAGNYNQLKKIIGRKSEYFFDNKGNKVIFTWADEPFWNSKDTVELYQYIQNEIGKVELNILKNKNFTLKDEINIKKELNRLYPNINFIICYVKDIKRTSRGKYRYLIQNVKRR